MPAHESDVCIIGGGITSAMLAQKLSELRPGLHITVVEAGRSIFDAQNRGRYRDRAMAYGEHPWPDDYIDDQQATGIIAMTMAVGGLALHWGGACNRFSEEDVRLESMYGLAADWPIEWKELERYYCEAERRLNVAGEPSPYAEDRRSEPYPQAPIPLSSTLPPPRPRREAADRRRRARIPSGPARRCRRVPREDVRHRLRLLLELASAPPLRQRAVSERAREQLGDGRPLHERPRLHVGDGEH